MPGPAKPVALVSGTFGATGQSASVELYGNYNFNLSFAGAVGTVRLERSFDNGVTWVVTTKPDLTAASFTGDVDGVGLEPENGVLYRWNCTAWTSGTITYRLSR